jgi:predicted ATP-grasp superfamily ATP-dependent carboligase
MYDYALRLLGHLQWTGLAMVEFKAGQTGPKLMEINGRVWGSLPLAVHSGMDFPRRLAELYLADPPQPPVGPVLDYATGVRSRNLELDIGWMLTVLLGKQRYPFVAMPARREAVMAFLNLFNPAYLFDILSLRDPRPGLAEIAKIARKLYRKSQQEFT